MVSGHSGIKIKVNSNMKLEKSPTIWKLSSTVLSGNGYSRNGDGIRKCFELNNENATCENADPSTFRRERVQRWWRETASEEAGKRTAERRCGDPRDRGDRKGTPGLHGGRWPWVERQGHVGQTQLKQPTNTCSVVLKCHWNERQRMLRTSPGSGDSMGTPPEWNATSGSEPQLALETRDATGTWDKTGARAWSRCKRL